MLKIILFTFAGIFVFFWGGVLLEINSKIISSAFNKIRPMFIEHGGEKCLNQLRTKGVKFVSLGENAGKENCPVYNAVRVTSFAQTEISKPQLLTCPTALAVDEWMNLANLNYVKVDGSYNCRKARNS